MNFANRLWQFKYNCLLNSAFRFTWRPICANSYTSRTLVRFGLVKERGIHADQEEESGPIGFAFGGGRGSAGDSCTCRSHATVITGGSFEVVGPGSGNVGLGTFPAGSLTAHGQSSNFPGNHRQYSIGFGGPLSFLATAHSALQFVSSGKLWNTAGAAKTLADYGPCGCEPTGITQGTVPSNRRSFTTTQRFTHRTTGKTFMSSRHYPQYASVGFGSTAHTTFVGSTTQRHYTYQIHWNTTTWHNLHSSFTGGGTPIYNTTNRNAGGGGKFPLFRFQNGAAEYGWLSISVAVSGGGPGPTATINGWAYDTNGHPLAAGPHHQFHPRAFQLRVDRPGRAGAGRRRPAPLAPTKRPPDAPCSVRYFSFGL